MIKTIIQNAYFRILNILLIEHSSVRRSSTRRKVKNDDLSQYMQNQTYNLMLSDFLQNIPQPIKNSPKIWVNSATTNTTTKYWISPIRVK